MATPAAQPTSLNESSFAASIEYREQQDALRGESSSPSGNEAGTAVSTEAKKTEEDDFHPGFRLWCIIMAIAVTMLLAALENTVITVAAPEIVTALDMGANYIWTTNAFLICRYVPSSLRRSFSSNTPADYNAIPAQLSNPSSASFAMCSAEDI